MRKLLIWIGVTLLSPYLYAQTPINPKVGDTIVLTSYCRVLAHEAVNTNTTNPVSDQYLTRLEPNVKFKINRITTDTVDLVALDYNRLSESELQKRMDANPGFFERSEYYNGKLYSISRAEFDLSATRPKEDQRIAGGLITLPFKARPQGDFTFDTEFNIK